MGRLRSWHESQIFTIKDQSETTALRNDFLCVLRVLCGDGFGWDLVSVVQPAVAPLALLIFRDALEQMHSAKIRPQSRSHINLGIRQLPQQKITEPHLAGRSHD